MNTNYTTGTWIHYKGTHMYKQTNTFNSTALDVTKIFNSSMYKVILSQNSYSKAEAIKGKSCM